MLIFYGVGLLITALIGTAWVLAGLTVGWMGDDGKGVVQTGLFIVALCWVWPILLLLGIIWTVRYAFT